MKPFTIKLGNLSETISEDNILNAHAGNNFIQLIKWYRQVTNLGLKDSKDAVEAARKLGAGAVVEAFHAAAVKAGQYVAPKASAPFVTGLITEALEHYDAMQYSSYEQFLDDYLRNVKAKGGFEELARKQFLFEHNL